MTRAPTARRIAARRPCAHSDRQTAQQPSVYPHFPSALKREGRTAGPLPLAEWLRIAVRTPWTNPWCATVECRLAVLSAPPCQASGAGCARAWGRGSAACAGTLCDPSVMDAPGLRGIAVRTP
eukprot:4298226-Prymnesium_polylepis.1